jgi:hypothetical protein
MASAAAAWRKGRVQRAMRFWRIAIVAAQREEDAAAGAGEAALLHTLLLYDVRGRDFFNKAWVRCAAPALVARQCARELPQVLASHSS